MPAIISFLLLLSGLIGIFIGQRMVKSRYDFFFRQVQPEDVVVCRTVFVCLDDGSYHKKAISNILTFGNDWKAFETDDGCQYVLGECFVKEDGQRSSISKETKEKWVSREELNQYEKNFGKPIKLLENNTKEEL
ncbi:hypothetical protein [Desulfobacula sp.]|uniref:hypothetical protein n=1 Tax=Desulfobacula sp. TaxID=2593537 RepID=UPI002633A204|nr:hypothetical protein [Desulfobacula sp.]